MKPSNSNRNWGSLNPCGSRVRIVVVFLILSFLTSRARVCAEDTTNTIVTAGVVTVHDAKATDAFNPNLGVVRRMVDTGLMRMTGKGLPSEAWRSLVEPQDVVGIKVVSAPGALSGTRPAVVRALVESLLESGHSPDRIVIWDKQRSELEAAGYFELAQTLHILCKSSQDEGWDSSKFYENPLLGRPLYGDFEFGKKGDGIGRRSYLARLVTKEFTKLISVAPVLSHNLGAVNGHLLSLGLGSIDNSFRFESDANRLAEIVPEIFAMPEISDHLVLAVSDALVCQYRGEDRTLLHYATPLNELRFCRDPVALDVLALADIERGRRGNPNGVEKPIHTDLFVNAALLELGVADTNHIHLK